MENSKILKIILILSGLILILVGEGNLMNPATFLARHEIVLGENISLISELKGHGGVFLGLGILIVLGAFIKRLSFTSNRRIDYRNLSRIIFWTPWCFRPLEI